MNCESYLKDSQQLLQDTLYLNVPNGCLIYSCDFESLYTNINLRKALAFICDFMKDKIQSEHLNIIAFNKILEIVFEFNLFKFKNKFFKQIKGICMGSKCGPSIANIFVYILERSFLNIHKPIYYKRFIDDIFIITKKDFNILILCGSFEDLKLNVLSEPTVNFLDLNISINYIFNKLEFSLYIKPTNTFCYLPTTSNHSSFIFKNIPKSIFMRPRRICSKYSDFLFFSRLIMNQLLNRGYDYSSLRKILNMVSNLKRLDLVYYKEKKKFLKTDEIFFKFPFEMSFLNLEKFIFRTFNNIKMKYDYVNNYNLRVINSIQPNLGRLFVHNYPIDLNSYRIHKYFKCNKLACSICKFSNEGFYLILRNNFYLPICVDSDCSSVGIIYIIKCSLCKDFYYIGQSGNSVKSRMSAHISDIKSFIAFYNYKNVSTHFNLKGHDYLQHFSFFIFTKNCDDVYIRLNIEKQLIYIFKNMSCKLMNDQEDQIINLNSFNKFNFKTLFNTK